MFSRQSPTRPHRLWTFSPDRLSLSSGSGIVGAVFGFTFTLTGLLAIAACGSLLLSAIGLLPPRGHATVIQSFRETSMAICALGLLGLMHLVVATCLLCTLRTTLDRAHGTVRVRSGWLGLCVRREPLSRFQRVTVEVYGPDRFGIVLDGGTDHRLLVGMVLRSHPLAREVATEIADFVGLPRHV